MVNASRKAGLGNTLHRAQKVANQRRNPRKAYKHSVDNELHQDNVKLNLKSVTAQTNLDEFFEEAELAGRQFVTERRNLALIRDDDGQQIPLYEHSEKHVSVPETDLEFNPLSVPRRPHWDSTTTPEELEERERQTFLVWRRRLAKVQERESVYMTPFEKNLEVWRQLWRVVERSDLVVQILDCRNPLMYLCEDLIKYVNEEFNGKKMNLILLNKADYLTEKQRQMWFEYFRDRGIKSMFFSALIENAKPNKDVTINNCDRNDYHNQSDVNHSRDDISDEDEPNVIAEMLLDNLNINEEESRQKSLDECGSRLYNKFELLDAWRETLLQMRKDSGNYEDSDGTNQDPFGRTHPLTVGLVGYPNVGKSSTINALLSAKRVAVSATPGKTKHFQTFLVDKDMMLCDCPGLVFPNFVSSKSDMVINGVLPIDQMKDYVGPVRQIVAKIPRSYFEEIYGLAFDQRKEQNLTAEDLLNAFGFMRGYMTARGLPDLSRAARKVCKDFINGKILYCEAPPDTDKKLYQSYSKLADILKKIEEKLNDPNAALRITERQRRLMVQATGNAISSSEFDAQFFQEKSTGVHIKGLPGIGNMSQPVGQCLEVKGHKREKKHKKREKLRRVYRHLDI